MNIDFLPQITYTVVYKEREDDTFMKKTRIFLTLALVLVLAVSLCACDNSAEKMEALAGTYTMTAVESEAQFMEYMESMDAYDEEIALADKSSLKYVQLVTFDAKGNYSFADDVDATKKCLREFYEGYFAALYAGRTTLNAVYETTFDNMTEAEFQQFYAEVYNCANFAALMDQLTEGAYDWDAKRTPWETGKYKIRGSKIYYTITGETKSEYTDYVLDADTLKLTYSDSVEVYTRVK